MIERHLAKLRVRHQISKELEDVIAGAISEVREVASDKVIVRQNERVNHSTLILDGWLCRYKDLLRGQRQITQLISPATLRTCTASP